MTDAAYHILAIVVGVVALFKGYHNGFTGQISGILGFAFGTVCAHVFGENAEEMLRSLFPGISHVEGSTFIYSVMAVALIYVAVILLFRLLTGVLRSAMQVFGVGILDRLLGAAFCLLKYMLLLSIAYNLMVCLNPRTPLMKYANADDGNIVECVLLLAPELLGCYSFEDLAHILQLRDARKISRNHTAPACVIINDPGHPGRKILTENA
ncbi:MAG: CvpA family protein [Muribaculaceae bacterium]|nr:CvpA family protein [Muribaculaceae bacterium]